MVALIRPEADFPVHQNHSHIASVSRGWRARTTQSQCWEQPARPRARSLLPFFLATFQFVATVHGFTSRGHQREFTTGQQKHVITSRTPYLGAYVGGNEVHVPVISIIHHKLCRVLDAQTTKSHKSSKK